MFPARSRNYDVPVRTPKPCPVYLSPRQRQVLTIVEQGYSTREIAAHLRVSPSVVRGELTILQELDLIAFPSDEAAHRPTSAPPPMASATARATEQTLRPRTTPSSEYSFGIARNPVPRLVAA